MLDAYTLRKAVPRLVFAAIAINLSIYLCLAAVDLTNVVGGGFAQLISEPFVKSGTYSFGVDGNVSNAAALIGGVGIFAGAGGIGAVVGAVGSLATAPLATLGALFILLIPVVLAALGVLITIVVRQALLVFLIITAPIAIALFVLPGTEKYFRQWWNIFLRTLIVYPIIAIIFAMSDVFGSILFKSAAVGSGPVGVVKLITGVIVIYAPLFMIPFAFRMAGGVIAQVANAASTGAKRISDAGFVRGRREHAKRELSNTMTQNRANVADKLKSFGNNKINEDGSFSQSRLRRHVGNRLLRGLAGATGGYNIEAQASTLRAEQAKVMNDQIATGRDEEIRGLTVDKQRIDNLRRQGIGEGEEWQRSADGGLQYKTLGGAWVDESNVDAGYARWGNDEYAKQTALSYEMRKANTVEEAQRIQKNYGELASGAWGLNGASATGVLKGAGFENQGKHLQFKYMNANGSIDRAGLIKEIYEGKGSYPLANMSSAVMNELVEAAGDQSLDGPSKDQLGSISETFMRDGYGRGQVGEIDGRPIPAPEGEIALHQQTPQQQPSGILGPDGQPISIRSPGASPQPERMFGSSGAGSVNELARELAKRTGRLRNSPDPQKPHNEPDSLQQ